MVLGLVNSATAQQWINPHFDTFRMDYRDLGYPRQNMDWGALRNDRSKTFICLRDKKLN